VCTGLLYAIYNIVSITLVYPNFLENMVQAQMARLEASGMDCSSHRSRPKRPSDASP